MTTAEAKQRFREAAKNASPTAWVREHPKEALGSAFIAGLTAGGTRDLSAKALHFVQMMGEVFEIARNSAKSDKGCYGE